MCLWLVAREDVAVGAITTRIYSTPLSKVCEISWVGGNDASDLFDECITVLEQYAKDCSCTKIEGHGRRGWSKLIAKHDWRELSVNYEKDI